jgi:long-chain acyl-CoA synthetase
VRACAASGSPPKQDPDRIALIEPDGREVRAGELAADVNRLVHGLRARGRRRRDP